MAVRKLGTPLAPGGVQSKNENPMRFSRGSVKSLPLGRQMPCRRSQWVDSNHRPPASETGALAKLSYTKMVAVSGLEPLASCIPSRRALHAALHHASAVPSGNDPLPLPQPLVD